MKKNDLDHFKLKLKYLKWERDCMFHNDSIVCSEYFEEDEYATVHIFRDQIIQNFNKAIKATKKIIDIGKETCYLK